LFVKRKKANPGYKPNGKMTVVWACLLSIILLSFMNDQMMGPTLRILLLGLFSIIGFVTFVLWFTTESKGGLANKNTKTVALVVCLVLVASVTLGVVRNSDTLLFLLGYEAESNNSQTTTTNGGTTTTPSDNGDNGGGMTPPSGGSDNGGTTTPPGSDDNGSGATPPTSSTPTSPSTPPAPPIEENASNGLSFLEMDNECYLIGIGQCSDTDILIPSLNNGKPVTRIYENAFLGNNKIVSITIPDSVKAIEKMAFMECSKLISVNIGNGVTSIGQQAFDTCKKLKTVVIGKKVERIDSWAFENCEALVNITLPDSLTKIGEAAFASCKALKTINIPDRVFYISDATFDHCTSLESITIGKSISSIGTNAFLNCKVLSEVHYTGTIENWCAIEFPENYGPFVANASLYMNGKMVTELIIPEGVTHINSYAFKSCKSLVGLTLPSTLMTIGKNVFYNCSSLKEIINLSYLDLSHSGFNCNIITKKADSGITTVGDFVFYDNGTELMLCKYTGDDTSIVFPQQAQQYSISPSAFRYDKKITDITFSNSVTTIGDYAFANCTALENIVFSNSITSINHSAFRDCTAINTIIIGDGVNSIGMCAFANCTLLQSVTLGTNLIAIDDEAFYGCRALIEVHNKSALSLTKGSSRHGHVAYYAEHIINE